MSAETDIYDTLSADGTVAGLIGTRIYPDVRPQESVLPAVVYVRTGTEPVFSVHGTILGTQSTMQVWCLDDAKADVETLATAAQSALVAGGFILGNRISGYDVDTRTHAVTLTVLHNSTADFWSGVSVSMQSALGANKTITGITKASPGVVTSAGHAIADGSFVTFREFDKEGMSELDYRVIRTDNADATTFALEGVDTSTYNTFSAGSCNVVTFGTSLAGLVDVDHTGGETTYIDMSTLRDTIRRQRPRIIEPMSFGFDAIWDPTDTGLTALRDAAYALALRAFRFTFSSGAICAFNGWVSAPGLPAGNALGVIRTPVIITSESRLTFYSA